MVTATQPISPALSALYAAIGHRERFESLLGASEAVQAGGIEMYRRYKRAAIDGALIILPNVAANVAAGEIRKREGQR